MDITFTRMGECTYSTVAQRDDGVILQVPSFDRTAAVPHDLAHYVVEHELGLPRGFWGCVAAGAMFPGIQVLSGRRPPHAAARSQAVIRQAGQHSTEAEVLVGLFVRVLHQGLDGDGQAARAVLQEAWRSSKPFREPLEGEEVRRVCAALREAERRWQALAVDESLTVSWSSAPNRRTSGGSRSR